MEKQRKDNQKSQRESNIEVLRILAILGVVVLHYNNQDMGGAFGMVAPGTINKVLLYGLESVFICGVNVFILISGYFLCKSSKHSMLKPIQLLVQMMLYGLGVYLLSIPLQHRPFTVDGLWRSVVPCNWFVILYIALYLIHPYLNMVLNGLDSAGRKRMLIIVVTVFSVWSFLTDGFADITGQTWMGLSSVGMLGDQGGYTITNFVMMYLIGGCIRLEEWDKKTIPVWKLLLTLAVIVCGIMLLCRYDTGIAWQYCSPLVVLEAVVSFMIFVRIPMGKNPVINRMAAASFSTYLLHSLFLPYLGIGNYVNGHPLMLLLHIVISVIGIYLISWAVYEIYSFVMKPIWKKVGSL